MTNNLKHCPECSNLVEENEPCEYCGANAVVQTCWHCNFGEEPCICGDSPDYDPESDPSFCEEDDQNEEDDQIEHYL